MIQFRSFLDSGGGFLPYLSMAAILHNGPRPFVQIVNPPFDRRLQMKFEENWSRAFEREVVQRCGRITDGRRMGGQWTGSDQNSSAELK